MLLPDNIHPELCIYYNSSHILRELKENPHQKIMDLFHNVKKSNKISFSLFVLSLDWLYLIEAAEINEEGIIHKCI